MKKVSYLILLLAFSFIAMKADKEAYRIFDQKGKKASYAKLFKQALESDVILFGELHYNPICHWLQLELTKDIFAERSSDLIMGAEMFERDQQLILNEYLQGLISTKNFESQARLWPNYKTDYKPLTTFARDHNIPFVATNIPRRYASIVYNDGFEGLDNLSGHTKMYFPTLPIPYDQDLPGYKAMLPDDDENDMDHSSDNLPKAQAIKDATMAYSIINSMEDGKIFIHFHGTYHSNNFEGIMWYLNQYKPGMKIMTIASVEQAGTETLEEENDSLADFILVIPETMTQTR
jgi:uncharacterized iron-regulated protein